MNLLIVDIENTPNLGYTWGKWKQNVIEFEDQWQMLCWSAKWLGDDYTYYDHIGEYTQDFRDGVGVTLGIDDRPIIESLIPLLDQADVVVAHNASKFDVPKINTKIFEYGLPMPSPFKVVDTLTTARQQFSFNSNSLDELCKSLKLRTKLRTGGFDLWTDVMNGDRDAMKRMNEYCINDTVILEELYIKMRPWIKSHPNMAIYEGLTAVCPVCLSGNDTACGYHVTSRSKFQQYKCDDCGTVSRDSKNLLTKEEKELITSPVNR